EKITVVLAPKPKKILVGLGTGDRLVSTQPDKAYTYTGDAPVSIKKPVSGPLTSPYGMRVHPITGVFKLHDGSDFSGACGTPIYAAAKGVVTSVSYEGGYGNKVDIDHGSGFVTSYSHLSSSSIEPGASVDSST